MDVLLVLSLAWFHLVGSVAIGMAASAGRQSGGAWFTASLVVGPIVAGLALNATLLGALNRRASGEQQRPTPPSPPDTSGSRHGW